MAFWHFLKVFIDTVTCTGMARTGEFHSLSSSRSTEYPVLSDREHIQQRRENAKQALRQKRKELREVSSAWYISHQPMKQSSAPGPALRPALLLSMVETRSLLLFVSLLLDISNIQIRFKIFFSLQEGFIELQIYYLGAVIHEGNDSIIFNLCK